MRDDAVASLAALAAQLVVDEGLGYEQAKHKAARQMGLGRPRAMPSHEAVEDAIRSHLALFGDEDQAQTLATLRHLAARRMQQLQQLDIAWRPHVSGAVWRGTATAASRVCLELYADDTKMAEMALLNLGVHDMPPQTPGSNTVVMTQDVRAPGIKDPVTIDYIILDADALRGALKPDAKGRPWRGDLQALQRLIAEGAPDAS